MSKTVTVTVTVTVAALSLLFLAAAPTPAAAQVAGSGTRCAERDVVGFLGISGIECDCTISTPNSGHAWKFRSEPKITSLEMDTRGGRLLKVGDVITHVNGKSLRTSDGAQEFADIEAGEAVILSIRRNGQPLKIAITAESVCASDTRHLGIYSPGNAHGTPPRAGVYRATPVPGAPPATRAGTPAPPSMYTTTPRPDKPGVAALAPRYAPRASFGMGLSCSGNCSIHIDKNDKTNVVVMSFSEPPEVYSIERGGPAYKAGIRRGDILTHINDKPMDSDKGGEHFANVKPGETVRFTIRRGKERKTISVKAEEITGTPQPELAYTLRGLTESREALTELTREQAEQMRRMQSEVRRSATTQENQLKEAYRELIRQEQEHHKKLVDLSSHLAKIDSKMRTALADSAGNCAVPSMLAPSAATRSTRTLRYSGTIADTEIEVRGTNPVSVNETKEEVVITTGGTVVRVSKKK